MKYLRITILVGLLLVTWSKSSTTEAGWMDSIKALKNEVKGTMQKYKYDPAEFNGIKWGTKIEELEGLVLNKEDKESFLTEYSRPNDKFEIGDCSTPKVYYQFYNGKFFGAYALFNQNEQDYIMHNLMKIHGPPKTSPYGWSWHKVKEDILIQLSLPNACRVDFSYYPLYQKWIAHQEKVNEEKKIHEAEEKRLAAEKEASKKKARARQQALQYDKEARKKYPKLAAQMDTLFDYLEKKTGYKFLEQDRLLELSRQEDAVFCKIGEENVLMAFICYDQALNTFDTLKVTRSRFSDSWDMEFNGNMAMLYFAEITPVTVPKYFKQFNR